MSENAPYVGSLPKCKGPKLDRFPDNTATIKFTRLISDLDTENSSGEGQSHVFEVSISSKNYALKIFKFFDVAESWSALSAKERALLPADLVRDHVDPFFNECRAYGRLNETHLNGKVAVRCHGYITLSADIEEKLSQEFNVKTWDRPDEDYDKPVSKRLPFRAVVKELVSVEKTWTSGIVRKVLKDLRRMERVGVYPMDIVARNYRGAMLVDFSIAITEPHYIFVIKPRWRIDDIKQENLAGFDNMMKDEGIMTWERAVSNPEYRKKIRSHGRTG